MKRSSTTSQANQRLAALRLQVAQITTAIEALERLEQLQRARVVSIDQVRQALNSGPRLQAA